MADQLGIKPWLKIWVAPRETIRKIVAENPKAKFILLSIIYGFPMLLGMAQNLSLGESFNLGAILLISLVLSLPVGMLGLTIVSSLLQWTGRWVGGKASFYPVRAAVSWSNVPNVVAIILWLILVMLFGQGLFLDKFTEMSFVGVEFGAVSTIFFLQTVISIWSFIILVKALGEVQGFSAWKALLNILIPFFMVGIAIWLISGLFFTMQTA